MDCEWQIPAATPRFALERPRRPPSASFAGDRLMPRGIAQKTRTLIDAAAEILREIQPATVRAVCYRLFPLGLIDSMAKTNTNKVSNALVYAREEGFVPWEWIVDETREPERVSAW